MPWWVEVLSAAAAALVSGLLAVLVAYLNNLRAKAKLDTTSALKSQVMESLALVATNIANKEIQELKAASADGKVSKEELHLLGQKAIESVTAEFKQTGIDVAKTLGPSVLNTLLRHAVDRINQDRAR